MGIYSHAHWDLWILKPVIDLMILILDLGDTSFLEQPHIGKLSQTCSTKLCDKNEHFLGSYCIYIYIYIIPLQIFVPRV